MLLVDLAQTKKDNNRSERTPSVKAVLQTITGETSTHLFRTVCLLPQDVRKNSPSRIMFDRPKSAIFRLLCWSRSRFSGFRSL